MTTRGRGGRTRADELEDDGGVVTETAGEKPDETAGTETGSAADAAREAERARRAARRAAEAARVAALAEEAAERAREAARLAQVAAEAVAAAEDAADAAGDDAADEPAEPAEPAGEDAEPGKDAESAGEDAEPGGKDAEPVEGGVKPASEAAEDEAAEAEVKPASEPAEDESADEPAGAGKPAETAGDESADEASEDKDDKDDAPATKPEPVSRRAARKAAKAALAAEDAERDGESAGARAHRDRVERPGFLAKLSSWSVPLISVLSIVVAGLLVAGVVLFLKDRHQAAVERGTRDATSAAARVAQAVSSYDYRTLKDDIKTTGPLTTGQLRTQYDKLAQQLTTTAVDLQAVSTTTVVKTGAMTTGSSKVDVLVYANRTSVTKNTKETPVPESLRIKITMVKKGDRWLASRIVVL
ncbi:hypothetical protein [Actinomadura atramentaria]|uniref:hypothetical protein n=1 Tax=Actinomadura atramentaria TaxID=1990 RepID=UPI0003A5E01F|nr:hypothetical protein [Actinomadura atramentaria]